MTDYQRSFVQTIRTLIAESGGVSPTYMEIAAARGISTSTAVIMVRRLVRYGYLTQAKGKYRTIRPV